MMRQFSWLLLIAVLAGVLSSLGLSVLQGAFTQPTLLTAETFEHAAQLNDHDHADATSAVTDTDRIMWRFIANGLSGIAFGLILVAGMSLRGHQGIKAGILWGLGGWIAFMAMPSLGLPPELPGTEGAPLAARQIWWIATVAASAGGLALAAFAPRRWGMLLGLAIMSLPHLIGAPQPAEEIFAAPEALRENFIIGTLATTLIFWLCLGGLSGVGLAARRFQPKLA